MAKLTIMIGLPASGKSTKAEELLKVGNTVRINKDLLRTMLHFDKFTHLNERNTRMAAKNLADMFLKVGTNVIIDDTNLNEGTVQGWKDLAKTNNAKIEYCNFTNIPIERCIQNDFERGSKKVRVRSVGKHVIQKMALQYLNYLQSAPIFIFDLDGTICDISHRLHFVKRPKCDHCHAAPAPTELCDDACKNFKPDWKSFFNGIPKDKLRKDVFQKLYEKREYRIIFVSARPEEYRAITEKWLNDKIFKPYYFKYEYILIMRESGDKRDDVNVKSDIFDKYLKHLRYIFGVYDDRPRVIRMWREKGLNVEDVGDGVEF